MMTIVRNIVIFALYVWIQITNAIISKKTIDGILKTNVIVIGGGAAGIGAAEYLHKQGIDFLLVEARTRLGGRIANTDIGGYSVELGANWIHGQFNEDYDPMGTNPPKFVNPLWQYHTQHPNIFEGAFTDYEEELVVTENAKEINEEQVELAWEYIEEAIQKCKERSQRLWKKYCQGNIELDLLEKEDMAIKECVMKHIPPDAPMDRVSVALRDVVMWMEDEFESGISNSSLINSPLNNVDRIQYNENDWFVKNG